jgi:hypothetical protein
VARPTRHGSYSFGHLAVIVLNEILRPVLARWHPLLVDYESRRPPDVSQAEHERAWVRSDELRAELEDVRRSLLDYAALLAEVAGVPHTSAFGTM